MAVRPEDSFRRAVAPRDLVRGPALRSRICAAVSAVLALLLLLTVATAVDVLAVPDRITEAGPEAFVASVIAAIRGRLSDSPLAATIVLLTVATGLAIGRQLFELMAKAAAGSAAGKIAGRLRSSIYRQHLRLGPGDLDGSTSAHVHKLFTRDVDEVATGVVELIRRSGRDIVLGSGLLVLALAVGWRLALQCLLLPAVVAAWLVLRDRAARLRYRQDLDDQLRIGRQPLMVALAQVRLVCGYGIDSEVRKQFDRTQAGIDRDAARHDRRHLVERWFHQLSLTIVVAVVLVLVARRVTVPAYGLGLSSATLLLIAIAGLLRSLDRARRLTAIRIHTGAVVGRIHVYLDIVPPVSQLSGARFLQPLARELKFESVSWQPDDAPPLLVELDLEIPAGGVTALVSLDRRETRAAAWLLTRFIDPHEGRILIDGQDIAEGTLESLREEVLYVAVDGDCLCGTVLENLSCGHPEQNLTRVTDAAKAVHAHHFITRLPQGYETPLEDVVSRLDAGQRFRLGLARAIARDPALLIIEEPDELFDADTKSLLSDTYDRLALNRTVLFLPGRLSTVRRADRVILLHQGRVEVIGTHDALVQTSPLYRHWEYTRFNEFREEPVREETGSVEAAETAVVGRPEH